MENNKVSRKRLAEDLIAKLLKEYPELAGYNDINLFESPFWNIFIKNFWKEQDINIDKANESEILEVSCVELLARDYYSKMDFEKEMFKEDHEVYEEKEGKGFEAIGQDEETTTVVNSTYNRHGVITKATIDKLMALDEEKTANEIFGLYKKEDPDRYSIHHSDPSVKMYFLDKGIPIDSWDWPPQAELKREKIITRVKQFWEKYRKEKGEAEEKIRNAQNAKELKEIAEKLVEVIKKRGYRQVKQAELKVICLEEGVDFQRFGIQTLVSVVNMAILKR